MDNEQSLIGTIVMYLAWLLLVGVYYAVIVSSVTLTLLLLDGVFKTNMLKAFRAFNERTFRISREWTSKSTPTEVPTVAITTPSQQATVVANSVPVTTKAEPTETTAQSGVRKRIVEVVATGVDAAIAAQG